jgi:hypothetical protein
LDDHPHLAPIIWSVTSIGFLLLIPRVQARIKERWNIDLSLTASRVVEAREDIAEAKKEAAKHLQVDKGDDHVPR